MTNIRNGNAAYLVNSNAVRAVRVGGNWNNGANDGFSYVNGNNAPSNSNANYGGDLILISASAPIKPGARMKTDCRERQAFPRPWFLRELNYLRAERA